MGTVLVVQALPLGQVLGVADRVVGGVPARHQHHVHVLGADRVGGDRGGQRRVDAAGQAEQHRAEAVLAHVVADPEDQRRVHLGQVVQPRPHGAAARPAGSGGRRGLGAELEPLDRHDRAVLRRRPPRGPAAAPGRRPAASRSVTTSASSNCGPAGQQRARRVHDDRVAVEDQLVLAADLVGVGQRGARLPGPALAQLQPVVVLALLVGRGVGHHQQPGPGPGADRHRAAVLPQVLADGDGHVHRLAARGGQPEHRHRVAGHEVAELVEHAVVGQVVLGRGDRHLAAVQQRRGVLRGAGRQPDPRRPGRCGGPGSRPRPRSRPGPAASSWAARPCSAATDASTNEARSARSSTG